MPLPDAVRLRHIVDAAREASDLASGRSRDELDQDRMLVLSLVKLIEIVGEAASGVSQETRRRAPAIPWRQITSMRKPVDPCLLRRQPRRRLVNCG
jgi:uncharacterized protein with HEPN domain